MAKITYVGTATGVEWCGVRFALNKPVDLDIANPEHRAILESARGNPSFEVGDDIEDMEVVSEEPAPEPEEPEEPEPEPEPEAPAEDRPEEMQDYTPVADEDELTRLTNAMKAAGHAVDGRWGVDRLKKEAEARGIG